MALRIYIVTDGGGSDGARLVRASNRAQAAQYIVRSTYDIAPASQEDLVALVGRGVQVEDATTTTSADKEDQQ